MRYRAFTVSRLADGDAVKHVQNMLANAIENGTGMNTFLQMTEGELADIAGMGPGAGWYYETVYRTNTSTAYNVGRAVGYEAVPPVALELIGIDDMRQTELCRSLTVPPFRRPYGDSIWELLWPPFHFNCRTTVRAIYDESEIDEAGGPDAFYSRGVPAYTPDKGFGAYPVDRSDIWWDLTDAMRERAGEYNLVREFLGAKEKLIAKNDNSVIINEEKVAETLHKVETSIKDLKDHEEGAVIGLDGKIIHEVKGKEHTVSVSNELVRGNIFTHNHPGGGCALSANDVISIIEADGYEVRAVTRDGRFVSLRKGPGELDTALGKSMRQEFGNHDTELFKKANDRAYKKYGRNLKSWHVSEEAENIANEWLEEHAPKHGYIFTRGLL